MSSSISFVCWKNDKKLDIQLEPEALRFEVLAGNEITFNATLPPNTNFKWAVRLGDDSKTAQLFPTGEFTEIEIFENGVLLKDWYKYMRLV